MRQGGSLHLVVSLALAACSRSEGTRLAEPEVVVLVRGEYDRRPLPGVRVLVHGAGRAWVEAATGAAGRARFSGVTAPYDLAVVSEGGARVDLFRGVRRGDPAVMLPSGAPGSHAGEVTGTLPWNCVAQACPAPGWGNGFLLLAAEGLVGWRPYSVPEPFSVSADWSGGPSASAELHALSWTSDVWAAPPARYWYAHEPVTLVSGEAVPLAAATLEPVATSSLVVRSTGSIPGWHLEVRYAFGAAPFGLRAWDYVNDVTVPFPELTIPVPQLPGFTAEALLHDGGFTSAAWRRGLSGGGAPVELELHGVPTIVAPAAGAASLASTFAWTPAPGGLSILRFSASGNRLVSVYTGDETATFPDLATLGVPPLESGLVSWGVQVMGPARSVDDYLAPPGGLQEEGWASSASAPYLEVP